MEPEVIKSEDEDKMRERDVLYSHFIAKYLDVINGKLESIQGNVDAINKKLHEVT
jgi:hypothetical protein